MGTAIVAIPKQDDYVWNISSEKIPHMTLLFLGDLAGDPALPHIEGFLEHASKMMLSRFSMTVDRRGVLGADEADVVFFDDYGVKKLKRFRANLLQDPEIRKAFDFRAVPITVEYRARKRNESAPASVVQSRSRKKPRAH